MKSASFNQLLKLTPTPKRQDDGTHFLSNLHVCFPVVCVLPSLKLTANAPENAWLEDYIVSFWEGPSCQVRTVSFREGTPLFFLRIYIVPLFRIDLQPNPFPLPGMGKKSTTPKRLNGLSKTLYSANNLRQHYRAATTLPLPEFILQRLRLVESY